jgi:SAM-dependent methyltransferase
MAGQPADAPLRSGGVSRRALLLALPAAVRARLDAAAASANRPADAAAAWEGGDDRVLGRRLEPAAERIVRASAVGPGQRLLEIGAGDGNVALAAAEKGADVVAVDLAPRLVAQGRARSQACGLAVDWRVGDAQSLPFDDAGFDCVASNFGIIHAPDTRRVVDELDRVLPPGGLALVTAWASAGLMGRVLRLAAEAERRGRDAPHIATPLDEHRQRREGRLADGSELALRATRSSAAAPLQRIDAAACACHSKAAGACRRTAPLSMKASAARSASCRYRHPAASVPSGSLERLAPRGAWTYDRLTGRAARRDNPLRV